MIGRSLLLVLIAVSLVSRPPWLCPITTICRNAGSLPLGSNVLTALVKDVRKMSAEISMGLPVLYVKIQNW